MSSRNESSYRRSKHGDSEDVNRDCRVFSRSTRYNNRNELFDSTGIEDLRISKLLRKLKAETDETVVVELCNKLKIAIMDHANANYIYKSFDLLAGKDFNFNFQNCMKFPSLFKLF